MTSRTIAAARQRIRPTVTTFSECLTWPLRQAVFTFTLWRWRRRPHRYRCPACGLTSADHVYCVGRWTRDERDMGKHKWYATGTGSYPLQKTWIAERMEPMS